MGQNNTNGTSCKTVCWLVALLAGILVAALLMSMRHHGFLPAVFWGLVTLLVGGFLLNWAFCGKSEAHSSSAAATSGTTATASADSAATAAPLASTGDATTSTATAAAAGTAAAASSAPSAPKVKPSAALSGEADVASRKGDWKYEADKKAPAKKPAAKKAAAKKPAAKKPAAKKATASKATATKTAAKSTTGTAATAKAEPKAKAAAKPKGAPKAKAADAKPAAKTKAAPTAKAATAKPAAKAKAAPKAKAPAKPAAKAKAAPKAKAATAAKSEAKAKPVAVDGKPELLKKARAGGADDLKQIKGVGPKLEGELNKQGVYHFDQVASWRKKEVEWADTNLDGVKGRVSRDEWVKQAKVLAKGGETEFSKKVKKGGVY